MSRRFPVRRFLFMKRSDTVNPLLSAHLYPAAPRGSSSNKEGDSVLTLTRHYLCAPGKDTLSFAPPSALVAMVRLPP